MQVPGTIACGPGCGLSAVLVMKVAFEAPRLVAKFVRCRVPGIHVWPRHGGGLRLCVVRGSSRLTADRETPVDSPLQATTRPLPLAINFAKLRRDESAVRGA